MTRRQKRWAVFVLSVAVTVLAGRWGLGLFTTSEFVHFSVNFPTSQGERRLDYREVPGPWSLLDEDEWSGFPVGGLIAWGREGRITVDVGRRGILKRFVQPGTLLLSSHWIRNVGVRPYRIGIDLDLCGLPQRRITFERDWDDGPRETTRLIQPTKSFNLDWIVQLPSNFRELRTICIGHLRVRDADTGSVLTVLPVEIVNSKAPAENRS